MKVLRECDTRWLSMLAPTERLHEQYALMAGKVFQDASPEAGANADAIALRSDLLDDHAR